MADAQTEYPKQTVGDVIKLLSKYNPKKEIVFYTDYGGEPLYLLSVYKHKGTICVDIGDE